MRRTFQIFLFEKGKKKSLRRNKSFKVIRFVCVIYCFINTFEKNLFSIEGGKGEAFNSSRLIPNHFLLQREKKNKVLLKGNLE